VTQPGSRETSPDRLIANDLLSRLDAGGRRNLIREIIVLEETDSTNDVIAQLGGSGAAEGVVVFAEAQRAGRGRLGRRWESASHKGLWFSLLLRPGFAFELWPRLSTWAAVAITSAVEDIVPCRAAIKWPNDVLIDGKKIAGVLIETHTDNAGGHFAVAGIGLNVNHAPDDFSPAISGTAGSLSLAAGHRVDRQAVAAAVLRRLDDSYPNLARSFGDLVTTAQARSCLIDRWIRLRDGGTIFEGVAERLDENGALVLRQADGRRATIAAGEVTLIAAASARV
jgi:BirA family transcriptional regulator, biotin operon repressor / biotin---[acetyl-CoA-carboxylase] ligase